MKKLNRILSLIICLVFTVTSFAFVNTSVDAATTNVFNSVSFCFKNNTPGAGEALESIDNCYGRRCMYFKRAQGSTT